MATRKNKVDDICTTSEETPIIGPLTSIFENPTAKILDQTLIVGNMEQTIAMFMELTSLSYKTVENVLEKLVSKGLMLQTRKIGNARAYSFRVENHLSGLIKYAQGIQLERLKQEEEECP